MNESIVLVALGLLAYAVVSLCDRGVRVKGISWFDVPRYRNTKQKRSR
ncbi:hypothetical protein [Glaciihabitans sp. dw_435]|nr:hypothetical protein [Glaciihabitans sp. dw_435]